MKNKKEITIRVTAADIKNAKPKNPYACPVFLAAKRSRLGLECASVRVLFFKNGLTVFASPDLHEFMAAFDDGQKVKPTTFKIPIPAPQAERSAI